MAITPEVQNSIFGIAIFGVDYFVGDASPNWDGIYYSKIFKKNSNEMWHQVKWTDNQINTATGTYGKIKVEIKLRTGNLLPIKNYTTGVRYTLAEINNIIKNYDITVADSLLYRWTLNRSVIFNDNSLLTVQEPIGEITRLGTAINSTRLIADNDAIWNYWSFPIINSPSFIPNNIDYDYIQARIYLQSRDDLTIPEMFRINISSILSEKR